MTREELKNKISYLYKSDINSLMQLIDQYTAEKVQERTRMLLGSRKQIFDEKEVAEKVLEGKIEESEKLQQNSIYIEKVPLKLDRVILLRRNQLVAELAQLKEKN